MAGQICGSGEAACIAIDQALAFVQGQLAPAERAAVEHRVDACPACWAVVSEAARRAGAELVRDARGRSAVQRPAVTAALRAPHQTPARPGAASPRAERTVSDGPGATLLAADHAVGDGPGAASPGQQRLVGRRGEPGAGTHPAGRAASPGAVLVDDRGEVVGELRRAPPRVDAGLAPGEVVGRYVVERPLGAGGMGVVSLARDPELRRAVVIKLVHPDVGEGSGDGGAEFEARLRREAQAMAQVSHTNVVQIFDIGRRGDRVFLAMEFVAGQTLGEWLREKPRTVDEILGVICQAGAGLAAAHRAGLVHRDFKPSNVLVGRDGVVKVTDFGLARSVTASGMVSGTGWGAAGAGATRELRVAQIVQPRPSGVHAVLTEVNAVVGTPGYMAPEQAAGAAIDARTDQYALGVTLLDALLGQPSTRRAVAPGDPAPRIDAALDAARVAPGVRAAILRALEVDPAARFPAVDDLLRALAPPAAPRRAGRVGLAIVGVALCGVAAAAWLVIGRREPACDPDAPGRWAAARDRVLAALSAAPRPFAGWEAERVADALDGTVKALATAQAARCRGTPMPGPEGAEACVAGRTAALAAAISGLGSAAPPPDDPWPLVRAIERCDQAPNPAIAELRGKLRGATAAQASEIAGAARKLGDDALVADASEVAGVAALAAGDVALANDQFRAMNAAGLQLGSAAVQGRTLLHLIELQRTTGEYELASEHRGALDALLGRYRDAPRDVLAASLVEGDAFSDLGDVAAAFQAWDRARAAADALGDHDAALAAAIGRARSLYALRLDLDGARRDATAALAAAAASPAGRASALGAIADLAIAAGDGRAAHDALDGAVRLAPAQATLGLGRLRAQRTRALLGDADGALAELVPDPAADPLTAARTGIARGQILLAADHASEAGDVLDHVVSDLRGYGKPRTALPIAERFELELAACEAHLAATGDGKAFRLTSLVDLLHKRSPLRARALEFEARTTPAEQPRVRARALRRALEILIDAGAAPVRIAELRWQVAQLCTEGTDCRGLATAARDAFQAAGRTAQVTEIDRWLADAPGPASGLPRDAGVPDAAPPSHRDLRGPQP